MDLAVLIITGAVWVLGLLTALGVDLRRSGRPVPGYRWRGTGLLLMMTAQLAMIFASFRNWPIGQRRVIDFSAMPIDLAALGCLVRSSAFSRQAARRRA